MQDYHQPLLPSETYHLFSRAVGSEKIFIEDKNYIYFLKKLHFHTQEVADIFTYSLLPNHFHLVIRVKTFDHIARNFELVKKKKFDPLIMDISDFIMERFSNFLNCYTKSINKMYNRKGALFMDYLKRSKVEKESDFTAFVFYTHKNAVHHGYKVNIGEWKYDAYHSLISEKPTKLLRNEVLEWFGGREKFIKFHEQQVDIKETVFCDM
jgi:REP element-mobilizing transposase RayT